VQYSEFVRGVSGEELIEHIAHLLVEAAMGGPDLLADRCQS